MTEEVKEEVKEVVVSYEEKKAIREKQANEDKLLAWSPKTQIGKDVKAGKEKDIDKILSTGKKILEPEIVDTLLNNLENDLIAIGQAKGKFGGGKRRAWRQTQKKTKEGNILTFSALAVVGDKKGHVGIGVGKAKETLPAREKAIRQAKLNLMKIRLGFENPEDKNREEYKNDPHTIPYILTGKSGSIRIKLLPAPRGTGLVVGDEIKKLLRLAGIKDVYSVSKGHTRTTFNHVKACFDALKKTTQLRK